MLCDFGLAKVMGKTLTGSTSTKGPFWYFSPELINDDEPVHSTHSEMWVWGCLALEVSVVISVIRHPLIRLSILTLTGLRPYHTCKGVLHVLLKIAQCRMLANLGDVDLPPEVYGIVNACWDEMPSLGLSTYPLLPWRRPKPLPETTPLPLILHSSIESRIVARRLASRQMYVLAIYGVSTAGPCRNLLPRTGDSKDAHRLLAFRDGLRVYCAIRTIGTTYTVAYSEVSGQFDPLDAVRLRFISKGSVRIPV